MPGRCLSASWRPESSNSERTTRVPRWRSTRCATPWQSFTRIYLWAALPEILAGTERGALPQSSAYRNLAVLVDAAVVHRLAGNDEFARYELTEDLAGHQSTWDDPISTTYRGVRVWECPPNGQGITALLALNLLEGFELAGQDPLGADRLHLVTEGLRVAFADARWFVADPRVSPVPAGALLSKAYAATRRALIDPRRAAADPRHGAPVASSDTVYFCVVDGRGNACSFINSNYMGFGTGFVPKTWGFTLQNRGACFSTEPGHPNVLAPRKRPYHTIIPGMLTRPDGSLYGPFGVMGGFMQPQGHVQVLCSLVDDGLDPQAALDLPRFCIDVEEAGGEVAIEEGMPQETVAGLQKLGHPTYPVSGYERALFGRGQVILRYPESDVLCAGSDPRADGCAMTL